MVISKVSVSAFESRELLKQAIAFIGTHHLSANPVNYTVCYEYLLGAYPALKQEIDQAILGATALTDTMMEHWFKIYLSDYDLTFLQQSKSDLVEIMSALAESTQLAEANVEQFGQTLEHSEKELANPDISLEAIVTHLLASTKSIQASMSVMRQQIEESQNEIKALHERLEKTNAETMADSLTGLANRKGLDKAIEASLSASDELKSHPCLLMVDIDHFKKINDAYGHLLGDKVIKVVADALVNQIKGKDTAARYGGEEFCVLLPETELPGAVKVAENIRKEIERTRIKRAKAQEDIGSISVSIGVTRYRSKESVTNFIGRADKALYQSKQDGRNKVTFID
ncbi:Diguanylate cyclase VdcA [biofilm metagenome]